METQEIISKPSDSDVSNIEWRDGQPYSIQFQDIYFSSEDGVAETEYVFMQGNDLHQRFQQLKNNQFTIIETGFGTGLNFLCAINLWLNLAPDNATLHYISTEKHPLSLEDISAAQSLWPDLNKLSVAFLKRYQSILNGATSLLLDNRVQLTILRADSMSALSKLQVKADAWFLDGFAPSKNPDMWQDKLFSQMARLSKTTTTFATFTSAGQVRRGLQAVGFQVLKQPGFGKKREMLVGHYVAT
ncbi:MAG: tRNA (5-methylaminomethyl-2-thiouridine)(34)-methyltransferase MnmD [Methylotenera sp.]|nr:tRNA (5-methylaminomethyl-2-thiouridine)(34)-methyltransferase MnmD [Methylotenera sp.]